MLVGEGANELGDWIKEAPYRNAPRSRRGDAPPAVGVLETLMRKVAPGGWSVVDAMAWKSLVKLTPRRPGSGDARSVEAVILHAKERGYDVVVFSRDRDGAKNRAREVAIEAVVTSASSLAASPKLVGAVAVETLEAWVLAACGDAKCESYADPVAELAARFKVSPKRTAAMVALIEAADLDSASARSDSLALWLRRARAVFTPSA
jgi:hypothetical protein